VTEKQQLPTRNIAKNGEVLNWSGGNPVPKLSQLDTESLAFRFMPYCNTLWASVKKQPF